MKPRPMKPALLLPAAVLAFWSVLALTANWLPLSPDRIRLEQILAPPSAHAWLGFDDLGRNILDRLVVGMRTSLLVAALVVPVSTAAGVLFGMSAAWQGGAWDRVSLGVMDVFLAFPGLLLAIALAGLLGPGIDNVVFALVVVGWVGYARLARAQTLSVLQREHIAAARLLGTSPPMILLRHVLPLIAAPIIVEATLGVAGVIVGEASLSFLGLGVQPPAASLGAMIRDGTAYMLVAPHTVIAPGVALLTVVLSVNMLGEALRRRLDVQARGER